MKPRRKVEVLGVTSGLGLGTACETVLLELQAVLTSKKQNAARVDSLGKNGCVVIMTLLQKRILSGDSRRLEL
jgi:hypothetical protein